jgi:MoaA/NifB/PqqE/SkfB family radical SAM enzyme
LSLRSQLAPLRADALLVARAMAAGTRRPPGPFKVTAAVTWVCEQHCRHCNIWRREQGSELSAAEWREVWREARATLSWIDLTGGEVTSRCDFDEIAVAAIEEVPDLAMLHFPTNGSDPQRLEQVCRRILAASPRRLVVSVSLDGPPQLHDRIRGEPGSFERAVASFRRLRDLGVASYFGMTLSPHNHDRLHETMEALQERIPALRWRDLHHNFIHTSGHYFGNENMDRLPPARMSELADEIMELRGLPRGPTEALERLYLRQVARYADTGRSPQPCTSLAGNCFIAPDGTVHPCHVWDKPVGKLSAHGYSLAQIWPKTPAQRAREGVQQERCPGCWTPCEAYPTILSNLPGGM